MLEVGDECPRCHNGGMQNIDQDGMIIVCSRLDCDFESEAREERVPTTMLHQDALNLILSHACPESVKGDIRVFSIQLHCESFTIKARMVDSGPWGRGEYEILSCVRELN